MELKRGKVSTEGLEKAAAGGDGEKYILRLYVTGLTPKSILATSNVRKICDDHLAGRYELEVIDLYQQPKLAKGEQIIATPTLIKTLPLPVRRVIGVISDTEKILIGIDLKSKKS